MEFHIENTEVYGLNKSIIASGNSYRTVLDDNTKEPTEKDFKRAKALGKVGLGEDQYLTGIIVQFDIYAPLYMWKEIQRYKFINFISSSSTMHCLSKFELTNQCTLETDQSVIDICQKLINTYNHMVEVNKTSPNLFTKDDIEKAWRKMIASLPCGFVLSATLSTNYRCLKNVYFQRKNHRLKEWHEFCRWCESLPYFKELIGINEERKD